MQDLIGLFDMDNTLFDYTNQLRNDYLKIMSPGEIEPDYHNDNKPWIRERFDIIRSVPGWWRNLPKLDLGWDIYRLSIKMGFNNKILTKGPYKKTWAWSEKVECIHYHFGTEVEIEIVSKSKSGTYGRFLCDDYPDYILEWLKYRPRGLVIMPAHDYNKYFVHPNVFRYKGFEDISKVSELLQKVRDRKSGEHWL